jgi:hypothetical protein
MEGNCIVVSKDQISPFMGTLLYRTAEELTQIILTRSTSTRIQFRSYRTRLSLLRASRRLSRIQDSVEARVPQLSHSSQGLGSNYPNCEIAKFKDYSLPLISNNWACQPDSTRALIKAREEGGESLSPAQPPLSPELRESPDKT